MKVFPVPPGPQMKKQFFELQVLFLLSDNVGKLRIVSTMFFCSSFNFTVLVPYLLMLREYLDLFDLLVLHFAHFR